MVVYVDSAYDPVRKGRRYRKTSRPSFWRNRSDGTYPIRIVGQVVDEGPLLALGLRSRRHSGGGGRTSSEHVSFRFVGVSDDLHGVDEDSLQMRGVDTCTGNWILAAGW